MKINIRPATESDLTAINDIYNHYVLHSTCTYQEEPEPLDERRRWFSHHGEKHPVVVAAAEKQVVGWGSLSAYHPRSAYRHTVENSVYVHHQFHRHGIGSLLLQELVVRARSLGHRVSSPVSTPNKSPASRCTPNSSLKRSGISNKSASSSVAGSMWFTWN